jgi:hypothetical protein
MSDDRNSANPPGKATDRYALGTTAGELRRLSLQDRVFAPHSENLFRQAGVDPEFGDSLPAVFQRAGLPHPGFAAIRIAGDADSLLPEYVMQTIKSLGPMAIAAGAAAAHEIARYTAEVLAAQTRERQAMIHLQELACAWARRPVVG